MQMLAHVLSGEEEHPHQELQNFVFWHAHTMESRDGGEQAPSDLFL